MTRDTRTMITWSLICGIVLAGVLAAWFLHQPASASPEQEQAELTAEYYCVGIGYDQYSDEFERCVDDNTSRFVDEEGQDD